MDQACIEQLVANCSPKFNEFCLEQRTKSPLDIDYYYQQLENSIQKFQEYLLSEVQQELSFFKKVTSGLFLSRDELRSFSNLVITIQKKICQLRLKMLK